MRSCKGGPFYPAKQGFGILSAAPRKSICACSDTGTQVKYGAEAVGTVDEYGAGAWARQQMFQVLGGKLGEVAAVGFSERTVRLCPRLLRKIASLVRGGSFLLNMNLYGSGLYIKSFHRHCESAVKGPRAKSAYWQSRNGRFTGRGAHLPYK